METSEKEIKEYKTIIGVGIVDFMRVCKEAEKEGWELYGNPMVSNNIINQVVIKSK